MNMEEIRLTHNIHLWDDYPKTFSDNDILRLLPKNAKGILDNSYLEEYPYLQLTDIFCCGIKDCKICQGDIYHYVKTVSLKETFLGIAIPKENHLKETVKIL